MIDFSKAFASVDHVVLLSKRAQLNLPIVVWICSFLAGKGQQCKVNGKLSIWLLILDAALCRDHV